MKKSAGKVLFILSICSIVFGSIKAQSIGGFQYINPPPNSNYVSVNSNIIIRKGDPISSSSINDNLIEVVGTTSGIHKGKIVLAKDSRTLIFTPLIPFQPDEYVTVILKKGLITVSGINIGTLYFIFHTCKTVKAQISENTLPDYRDAIKVSKFSSTSVSDTALPSDLPKVVINVSNNPSPGYFFLSASPYLEIVDNEGTPVFYRNVGGAIYDFDLQPDGELTYFLNTTSCYGLSISLDSIRVFNTINGYSVDPHDLRILPDGSYYIFGKRLVEMDLSNIVSGGDTAAQILDGALQEFDSGGNLIFQWDALENYNIKDVDSGIDLTQHTIDFEHFNSVEIDADGNLLISARNLDEITKVDHNTGHIIWRWGGKNNQFKFINDQLGFSRQHDVRLFSDGNISMFDNGVLHPTQISSAVEYKLDEINMTATLIRRIYHNDIYTAHNDIFTPIGGSVQETPDGNRLIAWGLNWNPFASEIKPDDSIAIDMSYTKFVSSYRVLKYQWKTSLFTTSTDSLNFGKVVPGDSLLKQFTVYNLSNMPVIISEFFCADSSFMTSIKVPVTIKANDSLIVPVMFKPRSDGTIKVSFNIRNFKRNGYEQMIARQVILTGEMENATLVNSDITTPMRFILFQNYPNPFNPSTTITYEIPTESFVVLTVYDILGRLVKTLVNEEKPAGKYSVIFNSLNFSNGIYFYKLSAGNYTQIKKMVLIK